MRSTAIEPLHLDNKKVKRMIADLKDKAVLVTGGSTGIGAAAAKAFAANGAQVMVHYNASKSEAEAVCAAIIAEGGEAALCHGDVTDKTVPARIVSETVQRFGRLDILINNAGGMLGRKMLPDITDEHYDRVLDLNIRSVIKFMQAAAD
ncbi:MAG: SDR family NAD(P)-dependent oxidoreductase, partial [Beijerinckiaceae bacterium]|nr:SDR family NAD(P)-dependent oxidoreductase [Beijerinckiaceae bacterium]